MDVPRDDHARFEAAIHQEFSGGLPSDIYQLWGLKRRLKRGLPRGRAFEAYRAIAAKAHTHTLAVRPLLGLRAAADARALHMIETEPAGAPFVISAPAVVGIGNHLPLRGRARSQFVACFADATVRGASGCIGIGDAVVLDFEGDELDRIDDNLDLDATIFDFDDDRHLFVVEPAPSYKPLEIPQAFHLTGPHCDAFGHWMWESIPKAIAAHLSKAAPAVPLLIDRVAHASHRRSLEMFFPDRPILELARHQVARVERLWVAPTLMYMPVYEEMNARFAWDILGAPPSRFARISRFARATISTGAAPPTAYARVFLSRGLWRHRALLNFADIEAIAGEHGFHVVDPSTIDFDQQIELMRGAEFVIAPEGSAIFLMYFSPARARLCILSHSHTAGLPLYNCILSGNDTDITVLVGQDRKAHPDYPHFTDYAVEPDAFRAFIRNWISDG